MLILSPDTHRVRIARGARSLRLPGGFLNPSESRNGRITVSVLLIFRQEKSIPPTKVMPVLAISLHLNNAPAQVASLYDVASADDGGQMHNHGKSLNLGGFAYPPSCTPSHKKIAPPKNSDDARIPKDIGPRRVTLSHLYGMVRLPMPGGGWSTKAGGRTNGLTVGFWRHPICYNSPPPKKGAGAPPGQIGQRCDTRHIPRV
jgi:hypothetical protein